jgi:nuclear pore complex protein Nup62
MTTTSPLTGTTGFPSFNLQTTTPASTSSSTLSLAASTSATTTSTSQATSSAVQASSTGPATTTAITPAVSQAPKLPSEIVGKSVEEIIRDWNNELQDRTAKFRKHATAIAEWDKRILQNRNVLIKLEAEVAKVVETQTSLERQLELIETHQREVYVSAKFLFCFHCLH